jgi:trehalose synthase
VNGFLVSSVEEAAECIVRLLKDEKLREEIGQKARETVREKFLLTRYVEQYLDLFAAFDEDFHGKNKSDVRDRSGQRREITLLLS